MAESNAIIGYGVLLSRGDGASPEVFTDIAELIDLTPPELARDAVEVTHTKSPGRFREFKPGLRDGGEFSAVCNLLPGNATQGNSSGGALHDYLNENVTRNWRISFPGSPVETWTFKAFLIGIQPLPPIEDRATLNLTFKVAGEPTVA